MGLAKLPIRFGEPSPQNIKSCFRGDLKATTMPPSPRCRVFCWTLSLSPRVLLKALWTRGLSSSSDSDHNRYPVRGGAGGQLSRNRRRCSAKVDAIKKAIGFVDTLSRPVFRWRFDAPHIARLIQRQSQQRNLLILSKRDRVHYPRGDVSPREKTLQPKCGSYL